MSYTLKIADESGSVTLSGSGVVVGCTYFPEHSDKKTVTETCTVTLTGAASSVLSTVRTIERYLNDAPRQKNKQSSKRTRLQYTTVGEADEYESYIVNGRVQWSDNAGLRRLQDGTTPTVQINIMWDRWNFWEGPEEELALTSDEDASTTGGVDIYNRDNDNWVSLSGGTAGTMPTPARIEITNKAGTGIAWRRFYLANNTHNDPSNVDLFLAGSDSGEGGASKSWSAGVDHNTLQYSWAFTQAQLVDFAGDSFRAIAVFATAPTFAAYLKGSIRSEISSVVDTIYPGIEVAAHRALNSSFGMVDLGEFPIPPGARSVGSTNISFMITARSASNDSSVLRFLHLMPADNFRELEQIGYTASADAAITDDGIDGESYYGRYSTSRLPIVRSKGKPIMIHPNRTQRISVLFDEGQTFTNARATRIRIYQRPRRATV